MATAMIKEDTQPPAVIRQLRADLTAMETQFATALPSHISPAKFTRVAMTAFQNNPKLLRCDRQSLMSALMKCAQDGLLPDGREAVILPYGARDDEGHPRSDDAQYLVMVTGLRKLVRNSGVLSDWNVQVVYEGDEFDFQLGDHAYIHHKPALHGGRARRVVAAYSIATFPDGTKSREVMNADQIEDIRRKSKAKKGPWNDPTFYGEMCRKTVARLHSKQLPLTSDIIHTVQRDDNLYEFDRAKEEACKIERPGSAATALDWFARGGDTPPALAPNAPASTKSAPDGKASAARVSDSEDAGTAAAPDHPNSTVPSSALPKTEDEYRAYARSVIDEATSGDELEKWFRSDAQRKLRNAAGVTRETFEEIDGWVCAKCKNLNAS